MKLAKRFLTNLAMVCAVATISGCSKPDSDEKPVGTVDKSDSEPKAGVTLDAETQERIGIQIETLAPAQWRPTIDCTGQAVDPLVFAADATDFETARAASTASGADFVRTQKLAAQDNASARVLETAQATAAHDALALTAAQAKFAAEWGSRMAGQTNLTAMAQKLQTDDFAYVKVSLPVGMFPKTLPVMATLFILGDETNAIPASFADDLGVDSATQTQTLLFSVNQRLPRGIAVTAHVQVPGDPVDGVLVPVGAVLRHEGRGWVYVQTDTNQFVRAEVPLDRLMNGGWFVSGNLSATNHIVVTGAQTVLSAELSGGAFTTGERD